MRYSFTQKTKLIKKLADFGISSEKDLKAIKLADLKYLKLNSNEVALLCELQEIVKSGSLYSYLAETENTDNNHNKDTHDDQYNYGNNNGETM